MIRYIETNGSPTEMGWQYGEACRKELLKTAEEWAPWFRCCPITRNYIGYVEKILKNYAPDILAELNGIAQGGNIPAEFIYAINFLDQLDDMVERCTPLFLRHSPQGMIVAKNNDAGVKEAMPFIIRKGKPDHGLPFIQVTYAGWLSGLDMINGAGVANTHGSVGSRFPKTAGSIDIRLRLYQLMQNCTSALELFEQLRQVPLSGKGFSIAVGDADCNGFFIDAAVPELGIHSETAAFAYSTNLYRSLELINADMRPASSRPLCLKRQEYLSKKPIPQNMADVEKILCDHSDYAAPCRHGGESISVTVWSLIALPQQQKIRLAQGNPCANPYKDFSL